MMENSGVPFTMAVEPANSGNCNGGMFGGDWFAWIFLFLIFSMFGWGGYGFGGFGGNGAGLQGIATRADINEGFMFNNLDNGIRDIQAAICSAEAALQSAIQSGFSTTQMSMMQGFNGVTAQICSLASQLQQCCCDIRTAVQEVNYNMSMQTNQLQNQANNNTRDIIESGHADTRSILDYLVQRDMAAKDAQIAELQRSASQDRQNSYFTVALENAVKTIIDRIAPYPVPSYPSCNPMAASLGLYGNGCNNGCNGYSNC